MQATQNVISEVNHKYKYGKKREETINVAEDSSLRFYAPLGYSTTRWAAYASETFDKTFKNYQIYYKTLNENQDDMLDKINSAEFVLQSSVLADISAERSKLSKTIQIPNIYSWNVNRTVIQTCDDLQMMADTLENPRYQQNALDNCRSPTENHKLLPKFAETVRELREHGTHQNMPIMEAQHYPVGQGTRNRSRSTDNDDGRSNGFEDQIENVRKSAAAYMNTEIKSLKDRFAQESNDILEHTADLFDLERVLDRGADTIPEPAFSKYVTAAYAAKVLDQYPAGPPPTWPELKTQYKRFQQTAHDKMNEKFERNKRNETRRNLERKFYDEILLDGLHGAESFKDSYHLLATATVRLKNESQVESMASQLKIIVQNRNLDPKKVSQEMFLTRNGPPPNRNCTELLRDGIRRKYGASVENWNFTHVSDRTDKLKYHATSGRVVYKKKLVLIYI